MAHQHESRDRHHHPEHQARDGGRSGGLRPHHKIGLVVAVVLMLVALGMYVLSNDEAVVPGQDPAVPAPSVP